MKKITKKSKEFLNLKEAVEQNKLNDGGCDIDAMVSFLKSNNIKLYNDD